MHNHYFSPYLYKYFFTSNCSINSGFLLIELGSCSLPFSSSLASFYLIGAAVYLGEMDPHGPGGGPGSGGHVGWGPGGWSLVPPGGPGFPGDPGPGSWGPGFGGFFGSCIYLLCCCCLLQDCCGPLFGHPGPGGTPPPF
uniref:Uncharacterized protein n=1 Tax=Hordeum vulgare subsp. vulgare TaxID=112509 RepID=A0A8I6XBD0_HORVV